MRLAGEGGAEARNRRGVTVPKEGVVPDRSITRDDLRACLLFVPYALCIYVYILCVYATNKNEFHVCKIRVACRIAYKFSVDSLARVVHRTEI